MSKPQRKRVLITGASSGIGKCCAEYLASQQHIVFGTSRNRKTDGLGFEMIEMDVTNHDSVSCGIAHVLEREKAIDVVVNNAGIAVAGAAEHTSIDCVRGVFDTNFFGTLRVC